MHAVIDRVIQAYAMMVKLTDEQQQDARERLERFLRGKQGTSRELCIEGLRFLRGDRMVRRKRRVA